jgi:hypothetical protein
MSLYLDAETIDSAIEELSQCSATPTLTDYLVFKRALVIAKASAVDKDEPAPAAVVTGTTSSAFVDAVNEVAATVRPDMESAWEGQPYFSPFGAARDKGRGFKSKKYPSNGPSDTVGGWQSRPNRPLKIVEDTSPKQYLILQKSSSELADFFFPKSSTGQRPSLVHFAYWWLRFADLEARFGLDPTDGEMVAATVTDFGLTQVEIDSLFEPLRESETTNGDV